MESADNTGLYKVSFTATPGLNPAERSGIIPPGIHSGIPYHRGNTHDNLHTKERDSVAGSHTTSGNLHGSTAEENRGNLHGNPSGISDTAGISNTSNNLNGNGYSNLHGNSTGNSSFTNQHGGQSPVSTTSPHHTGDNAYKMLGKRFTNTSRLVVSSKVWQKAIPTQNCDVLLTFPARTDDSTLMWLLARLKWRTPEIVVHVRHHSNSGIYGFYMTATYENLLKGAEELSIKKPLKTEFGGGLKEFTFEDQDCFAGVEEEKAFLTSQERQAILHHMINNLRAEEGEELEKIKFLEGQPIVPLLESKKIISRVFPLHCSEDLTHLNKTWVQAFTKSQPLDSICEYFGVKIAMYFAYLGHYTISLIVPTILGMLLWAIQGNQSVDDVTFVIFAVVNIMWATLFLEHWKRTSSELAYKWGTLDRQDDLLEDPRPLFKGDLVRNPVTDRMCFEFPSWKRNLFRYLVTVPVISICLLVVFVVMLLIFELQEFINRRVLAGDIPNFIRIFPKILLALSIGVLDEIYKKIAHWLNDQENYRLEHTYETALIIKLVLFQFVNSFLSLFYIAFYLRDMNRLRDQLAAILIVRQVVGNMKEVFLPYFIWKARLLKFGYKMAGEMSPGSIEQQFKEMTENRKNKNLSSTLTNDDKEDKKGSETAAQDGKEKIDPTVESTEEKQTGPVLTQAEVESAMKPYEDTWEDYMEMVIQFGYVTLFSSAFPLAALCAFLNNIIEIRSDAFKLCVNHQRPFGKRVSTIGIWQDIMEAMSVIAVIVNCALVGTSGIVPRFAPSLSTSSTILIIVIIEHVLLVGKLILAYVIPDVPEWVATEKAKWEFKRRVALKRLESGGSPDVKDRTMFRSHSGQPSPDAFSRTNQSHRESRPLTRSFSSSDAGDSYDRYRNSINTAHNSSNLIQSSTAQPTEKGRRLSESSNYGDGQKRVLGRKYTDPQRTYIPDSHREQRKEHSRNTSPMHSYGDESRHDRGSYAQNTSYGYPQVQDSKDTSPAHSTVGSTRSPIKTQLLEEYIASYNSALSHDRSQVPSSKYLDSHLRKRNLSPIKVSNNPGQWRLNRSPSPGNRRSGGRPFSPNGRPTSPIVTDQTSGESASPSPTDYKVKAPFATEMTSPVMRRRKDVMRRELPVRDLDKNFAQTEKKMQFSSKNVGDCLKMDSKIPVPEHPRSSPSPTITSPYALSLD